MNKQYNESRVVIDEQPKILTGGFSGDIMIRLPQSVLRIYKGRPDSRHIGLLRALGETRVAPQIYHEFGTGHIEEYINGNLLSMDDSEEMFLSVARALAQLHTIHLESFPTVNIWDPWTELYKCIDVFSKESASASETGIDRLSTNKISAEIESLHYLLRPLMEEDSEQFCLSHNDLFRGNIIRCGDDVRFIDWEMIALFHPLYDVANFFCECCIDTNLNYDTSLFPSSDRQTEFIRICIGRDPTMRDKYIMHLFIILSHLYWAVSGSTYTQDYSSARFAQYRIYKANLSNFSWEPDHGS